MGRHKIAFCLLLQPDLDLITVYKNELMLHETQVGSLGFEKYVV